MATLRAQPRLKVLTDGTIVRRVDRAGEQLYSAVDVVAALTDTADAGQFWTDLKIREPRLADVVEQAEFGDAVRLDGLLRMIQSIPSTGAERLKLWLARSARERLEEAANPELAVVRTRKLYENKGFSPRWVDKRLRGVSARHELTGEWFKRGATESEQYRALTNEMMQSAFGMDVESLRRHKSLTRTAENLRDHMTDLELALTALTETIAVDLHRTRGSLGFEKLARDAKDAGEIAAETRRAIESRSGQPVLTATNHRSWWRGGRKRHGHDSQKAVA